MKENDIVTRKEVENALLIKGQRSRRYKVGDTWELNFDEIKEALSDLQPKNENINIEDIRSWTPTMFYAKLRELENAFKTLQQEYADKKSKIVNEYNLVQTALSNRDVADRIHGRDN